MGNIIITMEDREAPAAPHRRIIHQAVRIPLQPFNLLYRHISIPV
ncbi:hypothetical protein [Paenibacillus sp. Z6-24]